MNDVITLMLDFFGVNSVPTDFPTFIFWFCSLLAGLQFVKYTVILSIGMLRDISRGVR